MSRDANNFVGAGAVGAAGIAAGAVGGAVAAGGIMRVVRNAVIAGDQGWDRDGHFVCAAFVFNFQDREVFDGSETHSFSDITSYSWEDAIFKISIRGRIQPKAINVGIPLRSQMLGKIFDDIFAGETYAPDTKRRLPTFKKRVHRIKPGTVLRYTIRSFFLGLFFGSVGQNGGDAQFFSVLWSMAGVFALSVAWRKFRPVKEPTWGSTAAAASASPAPVATPAEPQADPAVAA
jgi:hypothetical protein